MTWLLLPVCMAMGAVTFRIRGGATEGWRCQLPGQVARLFWAFACALTVWLAGAAWWIALAMVPLMFAASTLPLFGTIDMGRNDGSFGRDFALGHLHGLLMGVCAAAPLAWAAWGCPGLSCAPGLFPHWWLPLIGGAAWGLCYALAWLRRDWPELRAARLGKYGNPPEAAELLVGAEFAAALFFAVTP